MELEKKINDLEKKLERYHSVYVFTIFFILFGLSFWLLVAISWIINMSNPLMISLIIASLIVFFCFVALILLLSLIFILKDDSKQD
ncbi:MAG: hypothetical protein CEE42_04980 [Promethearchaeota archaeon Loki_b31]|nr:MAG: hypothetical protein CEE42_04980 [Candidatus Lokiarchaeota archaeon Loki_b31]